LYSTIFKKEVKSKGPEHLLMHMPTNPKMSCFPIINKLECHYNMLCDEGLAIRSRSLQNVPHNNSPILACTANRKEFATSVQREILEKSKQTELLLEQ
jgi:hypothetical protein